MARICSTGVEDGAPPLQPKGLPRQADGIAAGTAWVNGVEKPSHWVRRQAPRQLAG